MSFRVTRFSGLPWATEIGTGITIIGAGGIGSWTIFSLSRIGHSITIYEGDIVDATNVEGGQLFKKNQLNNNKGISITNICREFGCINNIDPLEIAFEDGLELSPFTICAVDNMATRKDSFNSWVACMDEWKALNWDGDGPSVDAAETQKDKSEAIYIDGRLTGEMWEVFAIKYSDKNQIREYRDKHLFDSEEAQAMDCTTKQTTFAAMGIAAEITAVLCNHLTNSKLGDIYRDVPFYQRRYYPASDSTRNEAGVREVFEDETAIPHKQIKETLCQENAV